jgi:beta-alanine degradation protein BauB
MKKILSAVFVALGLCSGMAFAQELDPLKVAPGMYSLVFENDRVRVMQVVFKPGESIKKHSHPDHYAYVLEGGQLTINKDNAKPMVADLAAGQVVWITAESHWAKNTGTTPVKLLVNELKSAKP